VRKLTLMSLVVALLVAMFATAAYAKIITGTNRDDHLKGKAQSDEINGLKGDDSIWGYGSADDLYGGYHEDKLYGSWGDDYITGGKHEDKLWGGRGPDVLGAHDGYEDEVDCGPSVDYAYVDEGDVEDEVDESCEFVNGTDTREE
jgi:Ca2+-binding RTX toxin-like protein